MNNVVGLHHLLARSVERFPERTAVEEAEGGAISYRELGELSGRVSRWLSSNGIGSGDRVGLYLHKSIDSVAAIWVATTPRSLCRQNRR